MKDKRAMRAERARQAAMKNYPLAGIRQDDDDEAMSDGTPLNEWQRLVIAEWHRRHPSPFVLTWGVASVRQVPRGAYCLRCKEPGVMFPAIETAEDLKARAPNGYFFCPRCSLSRLTSQREVAVA